MKSMLSRCEIVLVALTVLAGYAGAKGEKGDRSEPHSPERASRQRRNRSLQVLRERLRGFAQTHHEARDLTARLRSSFITSLRCAGSRAFASSRAGDASL